MRVPNVVEIKQFQNEYDESICEAYRPDEHPLGNNKAVIAH